MKKKIFKYLSCFNGMYCIKFQATMVVTAYTYMYIVIIQKYTHALYLNQNDHGHDKASDECNYS